MGNACIVISTAAMPWLCPRQPKLPAALNSTAFPTNTAVGYYLQDTTSEQEHLRYYCSMVIYDPIL